QMLEFLTPRSARGKEYSYYFETLFNLTRFIFLLGKHLAKIISVLNYYVIKNSYHVITIFNDAKIKYATNIISRVDPSHFMSKCERN
ncbi:hypothetical protein, partial [Xenorhabdus griffiniae]|uniref:hypothetical protein n=2 Tax=Xenorhabdus griffiniae TaxID=351672 RepID=UPI001CB8B7D3